MTFNPNWRETLAARVPKPRVKPRKKKRSPLERAQQELKTLKRRRRRTGRLPQKQKLVIAEIVEQSPNNSLSTKQIEALATVIDRGAEVVRSAVVAAREKFVARAERYADIHLASAEQALFTNEVGEARKAAEWALENMSERDSEGKIVRVIDKAEAAQEMPKVMIGIALGGLPTHAPDANGLALSTPLALAKVRPR